MDFTSYLQQQIPRFYGGSNGNKKAIKLDNGKVYMLKFPPVAKGEKQPGYTNSCISEHISCKIIENIGINVQKTILGKATINDKEKIVVACEDFTQYGDKLYEFAMIKNGCLGSSSNGYGTELGDVLAAIEEQSIYNPVEVKNYFWNLFIVDSLLGNFDRHNGNWGFLINENTQKIKLAPIYDCGSCLYPQIDDDTMEDYLNNEQEIDARVYVFPNSALKENGKKINYFEYISSLKNQDCNEALKRIFAKINIEKIIQIVDETPYISEIRKEFYKTILQRRYEKILEYSFHKLQMQH